MKIKTYHIVFLFCILASFGTMNDLAAQKKFRQLSPIEIKLAEARSIKKENPTKAIEILEGVFGQAKRKKNPVLESEAYFLLGEIYEEIGQKELALQRYQNAYQLVKNNTGKSLVPEILKALGQVSFDLNNLENAQLYFERCVELKTGDAVEISCREGLADVAIGQKNFDKGNAYNFQITQTPQFKDDSLIQSKVLARSSVIYSNQNQPKQAEQFYYNSIENIPQQQQISEKDFEPFLNANNTLQKKDNSPNARIALNISTLEKASLKSLPTKSILNRQLELADLYIELDSLELAEKYIAASFEAIENSERNERANAENKAAIYKKSSTINSKKGAFELALLDYQKYTVEKDKIIEEKAAELSQLIAILKGQEKIDLLAKDVELEEKDAVLIQNELFTQRIIIGLLLLLLAAALVAFYFILKNVKAKRKANQLLLLKSLRAQMNPHFIFNALNSVNNFIAKNDERSANKFLTDFSKLMRMVLNHSQKDFIEMEEELNLIDLYLKLEHLRFRDKFDYQFEKDAALQNVEIQVPPMLIQPFIENAIWHGLRYKKKKGSLLVKVEKAENAILIKIKDDGIGRKKSQVLKTANQKNYQSEGLKNVGKRLTLINEIYGKNYEIIVSDVEPNQEETGTLVHLKIPITE